MKRGIFPIFYVLVLFCLLPGAAQATWRTTDITSAAHAPAATTPALTSYTFGETESVVFIDSVDHVHTLSRANSSSNWTDSDLTAAAHGPAVAQIFLSNYTSNNTQHIVYVAASNSLHMLYNANFEPVWHDLDLTGAAAAPAFGGWLLSFASGAAEHVIYADATAGDIQDVYRANASAPWQVQDLSAAAGMQEGAFNLASYSAGGTQHVVYIDEMYGHVHDLSLAPTSSSWRDQDLTMALYLPQSYSHSVYLAAYADGSEEHTFALFFNTGQMGVPSNLVELSRPNSTATWQAYDLQYTISLPQAMQTSVPIDAYTVAGSQHVMYVDASQHVHEVYLGGQGVAGWQQNDPTASANAPVTASDSPLTSYVTGTIQHVFYLDENNHVDVLEANWGDPWK